MPLERRGAKTSDPFSDEYTQPAVGSGRYEGMKTWSASIAPILPALLLLACSSDPGRDNPPRPGGDAPPRATSADGSAKQSDIHDAGTTPLAPRDADGDGAVRSPHELLFDTWGSLRRSIRNSPDHLPARADRLVAEADPEAIYEFVRDAIGTLPPRTIGLQGAERQMRWGARGTLRAGAGTPRAKAELLASLYRRAGFEAAVVQGHPDEDVDLRAAILRPLDRAFDPSVSSSELSEWITDLGGTLPVPPLPVLDSDGSQTDALVGHLTPLIEPESLPNEFDWSEPAFIPLVRVTIAGEVTYANPLVVTGRFGRPYTTDEPVDSDSAASLPVHVTLSARRADGDGALVPLVQGDWSAEDLVGRQLRLQFVPDGDIETNLSLPFDSPRTFTPVLALEGSDLSAQAIHDLSVAGSSITPSGDVVERLDDGSLRIDGQRVGAGERSMELESKVHDVAVTASTAEYPLVQLEVRATTETGESVEGLPASSFSVEEDGAAVPFWLVQNTAPSPRVLLLFDDSDSVPEQFRGAGAFDLGHSVAEEIHRRAPDARFRVAAVNGGAAFAGSWTDDLSALDDQLTTYDGYGSDLWTALADAMDADPTAVVFITDADPVDELTDDLESHIRNRAPVVTIGVGPYVQTNLDTFASMTGGVSVPVSDRSEAVDAVVDFVNSDDVPAYTLVYEAPDGESGSRTVRVSIRDTDIAATASYDAKDPGTGGRLAGLYLTVDVGDSSVVRTLAGLPREQPIEQATPGDVEEVDASLFGSAVLSFEGAGPTLSQWLDDALSAKLTLRPLVDAVQARDKQQILAALEQGYRPWTPELMMVQTLPENDDPARAVTFPTSLRVSLVVDQPRFGDGFVRRVDILPLGPLASIARDGETAWEETLRQSARIAVAESATLKTSTLSLLGSESLAVNEPDFLRTLPSDLDGAVRDQWNAATRFLPWDDILLIPNDGEPVAFWAVNKKTGSLLGVLDDGSGGARERRELMQQLRSSLMMLDALDLVAGLKGASPGLGAWISLQKVVLESLVRSTIIIDMALDPDYEGPIPESRIDDIMEGFVCGQLKGQVTGMLSAAPGKLAPHAGFALDKAEKIWSIATGSDLIPCGLM